MEALVFGHSGTPLLVFPTSMGSFSSIEDRGDDRSAGAEDRPRDSRLFLCGRRRTSMSWYNKGVHPRVRVMRHLSRAPSPARDDPFIRWKNQTPRLAVTGCSFGA